MTAKEQFFTQILGALKTKAPYFTHQAIQSAAKAADMSLKKEVLNVYLTQAVKQGLIHDAGRGWYSRLSEPVKLDLSMCSKLVKVVEKAFPLLDFTVWSTAQLNPWMHHMIAKPVSFLYVPRDTLESVGEELRDRGWEVAVNPGKQDAPKAIRPGEKMVVLRPIHSKQPPASKHQASVEQVLVDLLLETDSLALMDHSEVEGAVLKIIASGLIQIPLLQRFAKFNRVTLPAFN